MLRYFQPISISDLKSKIETKFPDMEFYLIQEAFQKDFKVKFDGENFYSSNSNPGPEGLMGLVSLGNGLSFWGMSAGGDWEHPVFWIIYWDGKKLRAYIPTDGNPWNKITGTAYGNNATVDLKDIKNKEYQSRKNLTHDFSDYEIDFDSGKILNDILFRIKLK